MVPAWLPLARPTPPQPILVNFRTCSPVWRWEERLLLSGIALHAPTVLEGHSVTPTPSHVPSRLGGSAKLDYDRRLLEASVMVDA
jgi:hypothetical protein